MANEVLVALIAFGGAVVALLTAFVARKQQVIHRHEYSQPTEPPNAPATQALPALMSIPAPASTTQPTPRRTAKSPSRTRDGLNSSILPNDRGASGGKGLPPRTHAIHKVLFFAKRPLTLAEIEAQLESWGYERGTLNVTTNHLRSLRLGWGADSVIAVVEDEQGRYQLTAEGRNRLSQGPFSEALVL
jgi:hypothetical protein